MVFGLPISGVLAVAALTYMGLGLIYWIMLLVWDTGCTRSDAVLALILCIFGFPFVLCVLEDGWHSGKNLSKLRRRKVLKSMVDFVAWMDQQYPDDMALLEERYKLQLETNKIETRSRKPACASSIECPHHLFTRSDCPVCQIVLGVPSLI